MYTVKLRHDDKERQVELPDKCLIGRDSGCELVLSEQAVSRKHAFLQRLRDGSCLIVDLKSAGGIEVDGRRVASAKLDPGQVVRIGDHFLTVLPPRTSRWVVAEDQPLPTIQGRLAMSQPRSFLPESEVSSSTDLRRDYEQLRAAHALTRAIGIEQDVPRMLEKVLEATFELVPADRAAIVLLDAEGRPTTQLGRVRGGGNDEPVIPRAIIAELAQTRSGLISADAGADARFSRSESISGESVRSMMSVPLLCGERLLGVMHVDTLNAVNVFQGDDLALFSSIGAQAALAICNRSLAKELSEVVAEDQRRLEGIVGVLPIGVFLHMTGRGLCWANPAAERMLANRGLDFSSILERGREGPFDLQLQEPTPSTYLVATLNLSGREGPQTLVTLQDVTEDRLRAQHAAHADRLALVGRLASGVAHDFNNLLSVIIGNSEAMADRAKGEEDLAECRDILDAAKRGAAITKQLLAFSRRDTSQTKIINPKDLVLGVDQIGRAHV